MQVQDGDKRLRNGALADRDALHQLINDAFAVERAIKKGGGERLAPGSDELEQLLDRGTFLVLDENGAPLACVYLEQRGNRCYLGLLCVSPSAQGRGFGRTMMEKAEIAATQRGCVWLDLRVVSQRREELVPLYQRLGFEESGQEEYPAALAEQMVEPGHFVVMTKRL